ncbi:Uncharacterized iron-regulated membrane protein [Allopseudospirillum japonicum]|uniref:Uncharacterized iron-regulated membrane protein n=1 Tax=Allopseudospirillum japonicum TaxID=64971 RepID=A0A1H6QNQ6_9GAMM|nr:PepSY domain-containing protein [Allopseudospirillum japonicum]SEI45361.1 Uncharacterized iron-regulated membrane protein [Allopseudospirillum japonicum]
MNTLSKIPETETHTGIAQSKSSYNRLWRWHLLAGLYVVPFMLMLSLTGIIMMIYKPVIEPIFYSELVSVAPAENQPRMSWQQQIELVQQAYPDGIVRQLLLPHDANDSVRVLVKLAGENLQVFVDPYRGKILGAVNKDATLYALADNIHGTLLLGAFGDGMIELAAALTLILLITGLMMWWARRKRQPEYLLKPNSKLKGRMSLREWHTLSGFYLTIVLGLFVVSGLSWTGIWGAKMVQAWNSFPDGVFSGIPLSDQSHASLNPGVEEQVPWNLEQTLMPASGSMAGKPGIPQGTPVNADSVIQYAQENGMTRFRLNLPTSPEGVYTAMAATMSGDITDPYADRTLHIDQYTGKVLADVGYKDYSLFSKAMAIGIPLHMGLWGKSNLVINILLCLGIIFISVAGVVMWWQRKPSNRRIHLGAPSSTKKRGALVLIPVICGLFVPLLGVTLIGFWLLTTVMCKSKAIA